MTIETGSPTPDVSAPQAEVRSKRSFSWLARIAEFAISIGALLVAWHLAVVIFDIPP
jgi:hypothetical protein